MSAHLDLVPRYKRRRAVGMAVNHALVKRLSKDILDEGGKKLGILKGKTLMLDSEDELAVLMDFCIHDVRRNGRTAVESFLLEAPYPPDSEEMVYLNAMKNAQFSLFMVEEIEPGCGVTLRDLWRGDTKFLMDLSLGTSASPRLLIATRVVPFESVFATTGAPLPVGELPNTWTASPVQRALEEVQKGDLSQLSPEQLSDSVALFLRAFLQTGAAEHVRYAEPGEMPSPHRQPPLIRSRGHIGRNDPCPCGSGKKYKKCCGLKE